MQGAGCTERNLISLVGHIMALPRIDGVVDFFFPGDQVTAPLTSQPFSVPMINIPYRRGAMQTFSDGAILF